MHFSYEYNSSAKPDLTLIPIIGIFEEMNKMAKNTSITLGEHFEKSIGRMIESGRYSSVSEVVRAGLRMLEEEEERIAALKKAIEEGESSGFVRDFDFESNLRELNNKHRS